jgi:hypothetical protein
MLANGDHDVGQCVLRRTVFEHVALALKSEGRDHLVPTIEAQFLFHAGRAGKEGVRVKASLGAKVLRRK